MQLMDREKSRLEIERWEKATQADSSEVRREKVFGNIFWTQGGEKYHFMKECRGLRSRIHLLKEYDAFSFCGPRPIR